MTPLPASAAQGTGKRTQHQLEVEIENMGAHLNAYTSREQTVYYAKVFKEDVPRAVEILSDILLNSEYSEAAVAKERSVILREAEEVGRDGQEVVLDLLHETAFQGHGLARTILGPEKNIRSIAREDLKAYVAANYTAPRMALVGAGAVDHAQLEALAKEHFGGVASSPAPGSPAAPREPVLFTGSDLRERDDSMPEGHVAIAFPTPGAASPHTITFQVMQQILGSWDRATAPGKASASPLCQAVAENGLAHSLTSFHTQYQDTGLFGVYAVAEATTLNDLMWHVMDNFVRLAHTVSDEEVERAKVQLKASTLAHLDDTSAICEDIGRNVLNLGRRLSPAELFARIDAVDTAAVKGAAKEYISDHDFALAALGPIYELPDYTWLRRRTYWVRY